MGLISKLIFSVVLMLTAIVLMLIVPATSIGNFTQAKQAARQVLADAAKGFTALFVSYRVRTAPWSQVFQSTVALNQGFGVVGEIVFEGPLRATPGVLKGTAANIVVGRAFTIDPADGQYTPGGAFTFGGILANPKALQSVGTSGGGPLAPTLVVPAGTNAEFVNMGLLVVALLNAANIGDKVTYASADGQLSALPANVSATGSISTTVLTISAVAAGSAPILPGTVISGPNIVPGTTIISNGTGTGGTGTYNVSVSQTAASGAVSGDSVAASGQVIIPRAKVVRYANAAAGLAVIALTDA